MAHISKRMKKANEAFPPEKTYTLDEAVANIEKFPSTKFDETVELHLNLDLDSKAAEQAVRGTVVLPHGSGKSVRIAVICKGEAEQKAKDAGADHVGSKELIEKISKGFLDFDVVIASPDMMRDLSKLGKILGPRGLMPTPKAGTVAQDVVKAVQEVKAGKIEFKSDKQNGIHIGVGKKSFSKEKLSENIKQVLDAINNTKPSSVKGNFIKSLAVSTTMGPGLRVKL